MSQEDELKALARAVRRMRLLQKQYFRDRDGSTLKAAKRAEQEVDALVEGVLDFRTPSLFESTEAEGLK